MKRLSVLVVAAVTFSACTKAPTPSASPVTPVRVCAIQDRSDSTRWTRTATLQSEQLRKMSEIVQQRGGEIGFGLIGEQSDRPLARLSLLEPRPTEPQKPRNPIKQRSWEEDRKRYEEALSAYQARVRKKIDGFLEEADRRMQGAVQMKSDVCGAIRRCDLMLSEPFSPQAKSFLFLVTDGLHNVRSSACPTKLASEATVLLVNGSGELGVVEQYNPTRFESVDAALNFLHGSGIHQEARE